MDALFASGVGNVALVGGDTAVCGGSDVCGVSDAAVRGDGGAAVCDVDPSDARCMRVGVSA